MERNSLIYQNKSQRSKVQVGRSDPPSGPNTYKPLSSALWNFLSWSCLHHAAGPGIALFQAEHGQKVLSSIALSTAELSADLLNYEVEHKGNPETSPLRNRLAFEAQVLSRAWLAHLPRLASSASLSHTLPSHPSVLPNGGLHLTSHPSVAGSWARSPPAKGFGQRG